MNITSMFSGLCMRSLTLIEDPGSGRRSGHFKTLRRITIICKMHVKLC